MASTSSSVSNSQFYPRWKYDVFLSFRGEDTRRTFTGHLYEGLKSRGIFTFQNDKRLDHGDSISEELLKAIEESQVAVIVFSKNYATSSWCLNELVKIIECKDKYIQTVVPIFYDVDPSHVRYQSVSFAKAFAKHDLRYKDDVEGMQKVQGWRTALTAAADLKGFDVGDGIESEYILQIVDHISSKLCKSAYSLSSLQDIVGVNAHLEKLKSLLQIEINDVRIVGIWGLGGVGKTTIAKAIFDTIRYHYKAACFLANVKENAQKNQLHSLQNTLLSKLLRKEDDYIDNMYDGKSMIPSRLCSMKVLIVLDDIDHSDHLEYLAGDVGWFGKGSRVLLTTRNRDMLKINDGAIYEVKPLPDREAMQLFNQHAFRKEVPGERFRKLSLEIVNHAKGLPLALKVWGSSLHSKTLSRWERIVGKIKKNSSLEIIEKLKISYDGLELEEQEIFLDIACFFRGYYKSRVIEILESFDFEAKDGLDVLIEKSLVFLTQFNTIEMHDLIQDMGKYIVKMQKHPCDRSRLWDAEDFKQVMVDNTGSMAVEAIRLTYLEQQISFNKEAMKNMTRLRILCIYYEDQWRSREDPFLSDTVVDIEYFPNNLRWFVWKNYPWKLLPENFKPQRLVHLDLRGSELHHLWNETKVHLPCLRMLDLSYSKRLIETPDFTEMPNLEYLDLSYCTSLTELHPSLQYCRKLKSLDLEHCGNLVRFAYINVESLQYLDVGNCSRLKKFPEILGTMKRELEIPKKGSGIRELPSSFFQHQTHLTELKLRKCLGDPKYLVSLPSSICMLKGLVKLDVSYCPKLESLPKEIGDLENLEELNARNTLISQPPSSIVYLNKLKVLDFSKDYCNDSENFVFPQLNGRLRSLEKLYLRGCNIIDGGLPEDIGCLSSLKELYLSRNKFEHLPGSIAQLGALRSLNLSFCKRLKKLPEFIRMPNLEKLNLSCCNLVDGVLPEDIGCLSSLKELDLSWNNFEHLPRSIAQLGALRSLDLSSCKRLKHLPEFPEQLDRIEADWSNDWICNSLFQNTSSLHHVISDSGSLPLRVFTSWHWSKKEIPSGGGSSSLRVFSSDLMRLWGIPSWFHHRRSSTSGVSVNLPENWYISDNFLGFAVCYTGKLTDITAHLIPLCDDGMSSMTQKLALRNHLKYSSDYIYFSLVLLCGLWDTSKANGKTPNDYGCIMFSFSKGIKMFGFRLLYKDEAAEHCIGTKRSRDEDSEHHDEASCSSSQKQRSEAPIS